MHATQEEVSRYGAVTPQENVGLTSEKSEEVVVIGRRGEADTPATAEFDEEDIAADGADNIAELLFNLQPFIDPNGAQPVILINGRPAGFDTSILSYPAEALARVVVLKPEVGPRYGAKPGTRVVNLVLKPKFASMEAEAGVNAATAGGQYGGSLGAMRSAINGDTRWNARVRLDRQSALLKSARRIPRRDGKLDADDSPAKLAAGEIDPDDFETLQPASRNVAFGMNVARPLGNLAASFAFDATRSDSDGLRGIPMVSLTLPAGSRWSPQGSAVLLDRPFAGARALRSRNRTRTWAASLTLSGMVRGVQTSLAANVSTSDSRDLLETGVDVERLQRLLDVEDPDFDPYAPFDETFLRVRRAHSRARNTNVRLNLQKSFLKLPAGPLSWSFSANIGHARSIVTQRDDSRSVSNRFTHVQSSGSMSVNLPISSPGSAFGALGDLAMDVSLGRQSTTGSSAATSYGGGLTWAPFAWIQLRGSIDRAQNAPAFDQLNGPVSTTVIRVFDYARQEFVEPLWTTGGNPLLERGSQTGIALAMMVRPLAREELTLNFAYRQFLARDSPAAFPELTPAIEAAFPERVTRDGAGRLLAVDARPINIERQRDASLSSSATLRLGGRRRLGSGIIPLDLAADPLQMNLVLNYQLRLRNESLIRRGLPVIDRLADSGTSRHALDFRINMGKRAFGVGLGTSWKSSARVAGDREMFRLTPPLMFSLSSFANLDHLMKDSRASAWSQRLKISFDIQNLFNGYTRIALRDGSVPIGYSRDEVDPLGRTARLTLRKQF